jgi:arylsulfatase
MGGLASFFGFQPPAAARTRFTYFPGTQDVMSGMIPQVYNRSFTIDADLEVPPGGAEGVIVAEADAMGGFSLYVEGGKLRYTYSFLGVKSDTLASSEDLHAGKVAVRYEFTADKPGQMASGGKGRLFIDGKPVGEHRLEATVPMRFSSYSGLDIGKDNGESVSPSYEARAPFAFTGKIVKVVFDLVPNGSGTAGGR